MQLGTQTASLMNHIMSRSNCAPEPEVGMGATILGWTDRHAATVISWDGKILRVQRDKATRTDTLGMTDAQEYEYERDPEGCVYDYKRDRSGKWREVAKNDRGRFVFIDAAGLILGKRDEHFDFSF